LAKQSAGILPFKLVDGELLVFLVHPGGPYFARKDAGAWSIPKGETDEESDLLLVAKREFKEETGHEVTGTPIALDPVTLKSGKIVAAWACELDIDAGRMTSNSFEIEWPPKSGRMQSFPEVDRGEWFAVGAARTKINPAQVRFLDQLVEIHYK
jgi:predicted NUDIX family NTP pyrophosphohydrolase